MLALFLVSSKQSLSFIRSFCDNEKKTQMLIEKENHDVIELQIVDINNMSHELWYIFSRNVIIFN